MKSLLPEANISYEEFLATLQHIEQGIVIVNALKPGEVSQYPHSLAKQFVAFFVVFRAHDISAPWSSEIIPSLAKSVASYIDMLFGQFDLTLLKFPSSVALYLILVGIVLMSIMLTMVLNAYDEVRKKNYREAANMTLANRIPSICWDAVCNLYVMLIGGDAVGSHGKIRYLCKLADSLFRSANENVNEKMLQNLFNKVLRSNDNHAAVFRATLSAHSRSPHHRFNAMKTSVKGDDGMEDFFTVHIRTRSCDLNRELKAIFTTN
ncbi:unnamed protein product [Phytophthora fragariaefolia]|uniref:Unnamed protein product n=1 Tax=Phytophthora fragariaefolia TaxID=1490495 RepID=A0A9W6X9A8_9STRA|nr:unnamed protein product [Phytophthora fragariaefolia]